MEDGPSDCRGGSRRCDVTVREDVNSDEFLTLKPTVLFGYADMLAIGWYVYQWVEYSPSRFQQPHTRQIDMWSDHIGSLLMTIHVNLFWYQLVWSYQTIKSLYPGHPQMKIQAVRCSVLWSIIMKASLLICVVIQLLFIHLQQGIIGVEDWIQLSHISCTGIIFSWYSKMSESNNSWA